MARGSSTVPWILPDRSNHVNCTRPMVASRVSYTSTPFCETLYRLTPSPTGSSSPRSCAFSGSKRCAINVVPRRNNKKSGETNKRVGTGVGTESGPCGFPAAISACPPRPGQPYKRGTGLISERCTGSDGHPAGTTAFGAQSLLFREPSPVRRFRLSLPTRQSAVSMEESRPPPGNRMVSRVPQVPKPPAQSQSVATGPPPNSTDLNLSSVKNAIVWLLGDQNGP